MSGKASGKATELISGTLRKGIYGKAIDDVRFSALQKSTTQVLMLSSGKVEYCGKDKYHQDNCPKCVIADARDLNRARCKAFSSVKSLTETTVRANMRIDPLPLIRTVVLQRYLAYLTGRGACILYERRWPTMRTAHHRALHKVSPSYPFRFPPTAQPADERHDTVPGGDYSFFFGGVAPTSASKSAQNSHTYWADRSKISMSHACNTKPSADSGGDHGSGGAGKYQFAAMYTRNVVEPSKSKFTGTNSATNTLAKCADTCADSQSCTAFSFGGAKTALAKRNVCQHLQHGPCDGDRDEKLDSYDIPRVVAANHAGGLYKLVDEPMTWLAGHQFCRDFYFELASVHTKDQLVAVDQLCAQAKSVDRTQVKGCHTGLQDDQIDDDRIKLSGGTGGAAGQSMCEYLPGAVVAALVLITL